MTKQEFNRLFRYCKEQVKKSYIDGETWKNIEEFENEHVERVNSDYGKCYNYEDDELLVTGLFIDDENYIYLASEFGGQGCIKTPFLLDNIVAVKYWCDNFTENDLSVNVFLNDGSEIVYCPFNKGIKDKKYLQYKTWNIYYDDKLMVQGELKDLRKFFNKQVKTKL